MEALGREPGDRALDHHRLDPRQERLRLLRGGVIAGDQDDRDAMMQGDQRVQGALADGRAVQPRFPYRERVVGVGQDRVLGADRPVVGDHEHGIKRASRPSIMYRGLCLPGLVPAGQVGGVVVQRVRANVLHRRVAVVDEELRRPGPRSAVDRGVHLVGEQPAAKLVVSPGCADLLPVDDPGRALDVARDEYPHGPGSGEGGIRTRDGA